MRAGFESHYSRLVRKVTSLRGGGSSERKHLERDVKKNTTSWPKHFEWNWVSETVLKPSMDVLARIHQSSWQRLWAYMRCPNCWSLQVMSYFPEIVTKVRSAGWICGCWKNKKWAWACVCDRDCLISLVKGSIRQTRVASLYELILGRRVHFRRCPTSRAKQGNTDDFQ